MTRVTFGGAALDGFAITSPAGHIKLMLPGEGEVEPALPTFGSSGTVEWPADRAPAVVRTYTPRRFDPERLELDVEFFVHGDGYASRWAAAAKPGDRAAVAGPGRGYQPDPDADWFLIGGDESAIPAIGTLLEALPDDARAHVVIEVTDAEDEQPLPCRRDVTVDWLHRDGRPAGDPLDAHLRAATLPDGSGRVWVAGEAAAIRSLRSHFLTTRGLAANQVVTRGYWRAGHANHPDHDYGDDDLR